MPRGKWGEGQLTFKQWHHLYFGLLIKLFGIYLHSVGLEIIGSIIFWDDFLQHYIQWKYDNSYVSPLKYLFIKLIWEPLYARKDL